MKQLETTEKRIGDSIFYIKPFPAFVAANISGDLAALITPLLGGLAPLLGNGTAQNGDVMDMDVSDVLPSLTEAFSSLSGDKFERLMKKLLIDHKNIAVVNEETTNGEVQLMSYDLANEVFCGEVQDMYILCWEVIRLNFKGFFKKLGTRFGGVIQAITQKTGTPSTANGESLT